MSRTLASMGRIVRWVFQVTVFTYATLGTAVTTRAATPRVGAGESGEAIDPRNLFIIVLIAGVALLGARGTGKGPTK
jgi:hypothetical protein